MTIGERIKNARISANMTQAELARKMDIPYQSIGNWERDLSSPKYSSLEKIAEALGISIDSLILGKTADSSEMITDSNLFCSIYRELDRTMMQTEATDMSKYNAWQQVRSDAEKFFAEDTAHMVQHISSQNCQKKMDSETARELNWLNDIIKHIMEILCADKQLDDVTRKNNAWMLDAALLNREEILKPFYEQFL